MTCHFVWFSLHSVCHAFPHIMNIHQLKISRLQEYFDNQEHTIPTQSVRKKIVILPFLRTKISLKIKMATRLLDKSIGKVTITILHFLNAQSKMRHKEYTKSCIWVIKSLQDISKKACSHWINNVFLQHSYKTLTPFRCKSDHSAHTFPCMHISISLLPA